MLLKFDRLKIFVWNLLPLTTTNYTIVRGVKLLWTNCIWTIFQTKLDLDGLKLSRERIKILYLMTLFKSFYRCYENLHFWLIPMCLRVQHSRSVHFSHGYITFHHPMSSENERDGGGLLILQTCTKIIKNTNEIMMMIEFSFFSINF